MIDFTAYNLEDFRQKSYNYIKFNTARVKCKDVFEGEEKIKEKGLLYLPIVGMQTDEMYLNYKQRARFFNVFKKTINGLAGLITRKNATLNKEELSEKSDLFFDDVTLTGESLEEYVERVIIDTLKTGFSGTLVDYPTVDGNLTVAEVEEKGIRANLTHYNFENIINYDYETIDGIKKLSLLVLNYKEVNYKNVFKKELVEVFNILMLDTMEEDVEGVYQKRYYRNVIVKIIDGLPIVTNDSFPLVNNKNIDIIPFFFHGFDDYPPLNDLVNTNLSHYQIKADHNHCLHYIGLPTPIFPGVDPTDKNKPKTLGPSRIVYISDPSAKPYYMELEGKALSELTDELKKLEEDMAFLGASMLTSDINQQETATKAEIRYTTETSTLVLIANNISKTITNALNFALQWNGEKGKVLFELNKDFNPLRLSSQDIAVYLNAVSLGKMSNRTFFNILQKGEIYGFEQTFEDEQELITNGE